MTVMGFHASHEQVHPSALLDAVQLAGQAGFTAAMCSDHLAPRSERQGQSAFAWSWLGAAMHATSLPFGVVNAPGQRYHPVVVAQAVATLAAQGAAQGATARVRRRHPPPARRRGGQPTTGWSRSTAAASGRCPTSRRTSSALRSAWRPRAGSPPGPTRSSPSTSRTTTCGRWSRRTGRRAGAARWCCRYACRTPPTSGGRRPRRSTSGAPTSSVHPSLGPGHAGGLRRGREAPAAGRGQGVRRAGAARRVDRRVRRARVRRGGPPRRRPGAAGVAGRVARTGDHRPRPRSPRALPSPCRERNPR